MMIIFSFCELPVFDHGGATRETHLLVQLCFEFSYELTLINIKEVYI
jgi:hypothetical protein